MHFIPPSTHGQPYWMDSVTIPTFPPLQENLKVDVVIVGGGITGITAAYLFKKNGYRVALLEREEFGGVDSCRTTAHLTYVTDTRLTSLAKTCGENHAQAAWSAGAAAIDQIERIIKQEAIECEFKWIPGYLHAPIDGSRKDSELIKDAELAVALGFPAKFLEAVPHFGLPGIEFGHQARFHPMKYLMALLRRIPGNGSHVLANSPVSEFHDQPLSVKCGKNSIRCRYVVLATHNPVMGNTGLVSATLFQTKLALYTSYVIGAQLPRGTLPDASFWDTSEPYYYSRLAPQKDADYLIFGGEDHKTGQEQGAVEAFSRLEKTLHHHFPQAQPVHRWSGQVIETPDGLPFIGETADRQFIATGFAGNGMTFGTLSAMMALDAFERRKNPWAELFAPGRKKLRTTWDYLKENKDYPYYLLRDWLARAESTTTRGVKRNHGRILNLHGRKVAAYRDAMGKVTLCSPVCTHMKCIVRWNDAEKTWDCPCHGSRFKPTGEVLSGPAEQALEKVPAPHP